MGEIVFYNFFFTFLLYSWKRLENNYVKEQTHNMGCLDYSENENQLIVGKS